MPWPPEYQRASIDFEKFMVAARDHAGLATTNMAWNMVEGVLHAFRRRLSLEQALRFADQLPPAVRGLFIEGWRPLEHVATAGTRTEILEEVRSLRREHNFSPDNAIESVGFALSSVVSIRCSHSRTGCPPARASQALKRRDHEQLRSICGVGRGLKAAQPPESAAVMETAEDIVRKFWCLMATNDFHSVESVVGSTFTVEWPQSNELIRGVNNFARVNAEYPAHGLWSFTIHRLVASSDEVVTCVRVTDGIQSADAISFFELHDGRIIRIVEYWPENYPPPGNRAHLTEPLDGVARKPDESVA